MKADYDRAWIEPNARRAVLQAVRYGVRHVLAFADVDTKARLEGVIPLLALREEFRGVVDLQVVAFPQDGLLCDPGAEDLVREAVDLGADVVGGIPWIEHTDAEAREHVRRMCELAAAHGRRVAMLVDDAGDPNLRTTEMLATAMLEHGLSRPRRRQPRPRGRPLRPPEPGAPRRPRQARRARLRQRPAHRPAAPAGPRAHRDGRPGRARPGRHRGRVLPVRPAQHGRDRVPRRARARGGRHRRHRPRVRRRHDDRRPGARRQPATGSRRAATPTWSSTSTRRCARSSATTTRRRTWSRRAGWWRARRHHDVPHREEHA